MILRGSFITVATQGDYGKPRPALVIQSNAFSNMLSLTICPLTSADGFQTETIRVLARPDGTNGLKRDSLVMIDKITTTPVRKVGSVIGTADAELMFEVDRALAVFLGLS